MHHFRHDEDIYTTVHDNHSAGLHPGSALVADNHEWIVYNTLTYAGKQVMETVTAVDLEWLIVSNHCYTFLFFLFFLFISL